LIRFSDVDGLEGPEPTGFTKRYFNALDKVYADTLSPGTAFAATSTPSLSVLSQPAAQPTVISVQQVPNLYTEYDKQVAAGLVPWYERAGVWVARNTLFPDTDNGYIVTYSDDSQVFKLGGGPSTMGMIGQAAVFAPVLRLGSAGSGAAVTSKTINVTERGLQHVVERHIPGGLQSAGKSVFSAGEDISALIRQAQSVTPTQQAGGNLQRIVNAGKTIGIDRATGKPTSVYTVITNKSGDLITTFPGKP